MDLDVLWKSMKDNYNESRRPGERSRVGFTAYCTQLGQNKIGLFIGTFSISSQLLIFVKVYDIPVSPLLIVPLIGVCAISFFSLGLGWIALGFRKEELYVDAKNNPVFIEITRRFDELEAELKKR